VTGDPKRYRVVICRGPECGEQRGSAALHDCFLRRARELGLESRLELGWQACFGRCRQGPNVLVRIAPATPPRTLLATLPSGPGQNAALYNGVRPDNLHDDVGKILQSHVARGIIVRELVLRPDAYHPPAVTPAGTSAVPEGGAAQPQTATAADPATSSPPKNAPNDKEPGGEPK
jgi:(2Fe-2S) ferredoxin